MALATTAAARTDALGAAPAERESASLDSTATRLRRARWSVRTRMVTWFIGLFTVAMLASVFVTREVLLIRLDQRIDNELVQESAELRRAAGGTDPTTGRPFGSNVRRVFEVYLQRNVASRHEVFITFLAGKPFLRSPQLAPYRLDRDPDLVSQWGSVAQPDRGRVTTPAGRVEYLAVPLRTDGRTAGVFVAATFRDRATAELDAVVRATAAVGLVFLAFGALVAWRLSDTVIHPISRLRRTARAISDTDLSRRIPVQGRDELAQLAVTFNEMLDRLERAFASQRRFIDDAGHELRTPLTIVRGHLEMLGDDPREVRETFALVVDELDRMARIVDDLLLLAKHEQLDFLDLTTVGVGELTEELHAKLTALAPRDWILEQRGRGVIVADRQRLTQAIVQLAENAVRYSDAEEPVGVGSLVTGSEARFWVRDRGPGIPRGEQAAIFERFHRGSDPRRSEGAGLGLAIVKAIAEAHRGRVEVRGESGAGTTFTIVVPVDPPLAGESRLP